MQIAQVLAGYSLGGADLLRRAMGKKKPEEKRIRYGLGAVKGVGSTAAQAIAVKRPSRVAPSAIVWRDAGW